MRQPKPSNRNILPIAILEILSRHSDVEHPLQQKDIAHYLNEEYALTPHRKTLSLHLDQLIEAEAPIACDETERHLPDGEVQRVRTNYYYEHAFDESELMLLIDSIFASKQIPPKRSNALIKKLYSLGSSFVRDRSRHVRSLTHKQVHNEQYFYTISMLDEAIENGQSITCEYLSYNLNLRMEPRRDRHGEIRQYHLDPYELAAVNGYYYLICSKRPYESISHYRVDRIFNIRIEEDIPIRSADELGQIPRDLSLPKHLAEHIYMFDGPTVQARFYADRSLLDALMDWFGETLRVTEMPDQNLLVSVQVNEQAMFYWSLQYGPHIEVLEPASLRERLRLQLNDMVLRYSSDPPEY